MLDKTQSPCSNIFIFFVFFYRYFSYLGTHGDRMKFDLAQAAAEAR
jgi:hypothetical protein